MYGEIETEGLAIVTETEFMLLLYVFSIAIITVNLKQFTAA